MAAKRWRLWLCPAKGLLSSVLLGSRSSRTSQRRSPTTSGGVSKPIVGRLGTRRRNSGQVDYLRNLNPDYRDSVLCASADRTVPAFLAGKAESDRAASVL